MYPATSAYCAHRKLSEVTRSAVHDGGRQLDEAARQPGATRTKGALSVSAEELAADAFGAAHAFLSGGRHDFSGVQAMILSVVKRGDEIILPRNVHRSVINALVQRPVRFRFMSTRR